jgi:hypothetical protein
VNPQLKLWATFGCRNAAEKCPRTQIKWFAENGWTSRFYWRKLKFVKSNGRKFVTYLITNLTQEKYEHAHIGLHYCFAVPAYN